MGKLAELAGTPKLKGQVGVTTLKGVTTVYGGEAEAEIACVGMQLEHRRGAFFEKAPEAPKAPKAKRKRKAEDSSESA